MGKQQEKYRLSRRIGGKLRELRRNYGMTQEDLAEKLEIHPSYVGQLERGEREASLHTLEKLAQAFDVPPSEFIEEEVNEEKDALRKECEKLLAKCSAAQLVSVRSLLSSFLYRK